MSYPPGNSVNDFIDEKLTAVQYSKFEYVISIIQTLCEHVKIGGMYHIDKCMPMGCSITCSTLENFYKFVQWFVQKVLGLKNLDHYLDDFVFLKYRIMNA